MNTFQDIPQLMKFRRVLFVVCQVLQMLQVVLRLDPKAMLQASLDPKAVLAVLAYFLLLLGVGQTLKQFLQTTFVVVQLLA